jgi:PhzF family phenazine biosynthesis protein
MECTGPLSDRVVRLGDARQNANHPPPPAANLLSGSVSQHLCQANLAISSRSTIMTARIIQVDSFSNRPFAGNPAAICLLDAPAPEPWMQHVATEMNLSETAFLHRLDSGPEYRLRWFTPRVEVDLCGHATLAAAHVLWEERLLDEEAPALFQTRSGRLTALRRGDWIELDFPSEPINSPITESAEIDRITTALGAPVISAGRNRFDLLVELDDEETLRGLAPNISLVASFPARGLIATSRSAEPGFDFVSRFFAPRVGVDEDPVCGSAHCCLGPFWASKLGRTELCGHQVSPRGGVVKVRVGESRVALIGQAVTVLRGELIA